MTSSLREETLFHEDGVRMIGLIEKLVNLDFVIPNEFSTDIMLWSLPSSFDGFVVNFNMKKLEVSHKELVNMLMSYEATIKKEKHVFLVGSSSRTKQGPKRKGVLFLPRRKNPVRSSLQTLLKGPKSL
ncbi:uncharacterized protein LOC142538702 [Primulina tabacum]|uniref:uncharacterized protein LOC142538702 n=1 Tax=Primulina tabacum TaxID=48773 RepID=UPI003F593AD6